MLKGKVAVVTGSTSGIGLGIARSLAASGADLMVNGFGDAGAIDSLRDEVATEYSVRVAYSNADLMTPIGALGLIEDTTRELGRVDVLVNNCRYRKLDSDVLVMQSTEDRIDLRAPRR
jgi:3-hydroxybutyrate dehydrogenase